MKTMNLDWIEMLSAEQIGESWVYQRLLGLDRGEYGEAGVKLLTRAASLEKIGEVAELMRGCEEERHKLLMGGSPEQRTAFSDCPYPMLRCGSWQADDDGVRRGKTLACPHPILPVARLKNVETEGERLRLAYRLDGRWHTLDVDNSVIASQRNIVSLADRGILVTSKEAKDLVAYIAELRSLNDLPLLQAVSRLGWVGEDFAPYSGDYHYDGDSDYRSIYQAIHPRGSRDVWEAYTADLLKTSLPLRLAVAASCASALVAPLGINSFIFHLWGGSGVGKTVALMLAASVWGDPAQGKLLQSLDATKVCLERKLGFYHDIPLIGDELQIIKDRFGNYDHLIMFITEGSGRGRGTLAGIEALTSWSNILLSSGEEPITSSVSGGGAKNRCIELECKEKLCPDGHEAATVYREHFGHFAPLFLAAVAEAGVTSLRESYDDAFATFLQRDISEKQAMALAALITADHLVAELLHLPDLDLVTVAACGASLKEIDVGLRAYEWVINHIAERRENFQKNAVVKWGKIDEANATILINRSVLEREMADAGFSLKSCLSSWDRKGLLVRNSAGRRVHQTTLSGMKVNCVMVKMRDSVLDEIKM